MNLQDLVNLITLRDFISRQVESPASAIKKADVRPCQQMVSRIDAVILTSTLALEPEKIGKVETVQLLTRASSEEDYQASIELFKKHTKPIVDLPVPDPHKDTVSDLVKNVIMVNNPSGDDGVVVRTIEELVNASTVEPLKHSTVEPLKPRKKGSFKRTAVG